jgi:hypothetical protein
VSSRAELAFFASTLGRSTRVSRSPEQRRRGFPFPHAFRAHRFAAIPPRPVRLRSGLRRAFAYASVHRYGLRLAHLVGMTNKGAAKDRKPRKQASTSLAKEVSVAADRRYSAPGARI